MQTCLKEGDRPLIGLSEKKLDALFDAKFRECAEFASWFLSRTKFRDRSARLVLLRSNHPWYQSKRTGVQSETDILVVFEDQDTAARFAIHIENKLANGKYTNNQPQLYHERANDWRHMAKFGNYDDFEVVLMAPRAFYNRHLEQSQIFHRFVPYEDVAKYIPEFGVEVYALL
jgi:hypothetical protein